MDDRGSTIWDYFFGFYPLSRVVYHLGFHSSFWNSPDGQGRTQHFLSVFPGRHSFFRGQQNRALPGFHPLTNGHFYFSYERGGPFHDHTRQHFRPLYQFQRTLRPGTAPLYHFRFHLSEGATWHPPWGTQFHPTRVPLFLAGHQLFTHQCYHVFHFRTPCDPV